ncbi:MAG: META domain-containing protein [Solirubrobacterales bacterium]|nr:META domain-containing protein [Solirubrobacterales bacterium]
MPVRFLVTGIALILCLGLAGCGTGDEFIDEEGGPEPLPATPELVEGRTFISSPTTTSGVALRRGTLVQIGFSGDRLRASAGCGSIRARYSFVRGRLRTRDLAPSRRSCPGQLGRQQEWLYSLLGKPARMDTFEDGGALLVTAGNDFMEMIEPAATTSPQDRLEKHIWDMDRIESGEIKLDLTVGGKVPRVMFSENEVVFWRACNLGEVPAEWDDSTIETEGDLKVDFDCPQPHQVWSEALADVLNGPVMYSFRGQDLVLAGEGRSIVLTPG